MKEATCEKPALSPESQDKSLNFQGRQVHPSSFSLIVFIPSAIYLFLFIAVIHRLTHRGGESGVDDRVGV